MKYINLTEQDLEERVESLEKEVRVLKDKIKEIYNELDALKKKAKPSGQVEPADDDQDSWYTDHGHGD